MRFIWCICIYIYIRYDSVLFYLSVYLQYTTCSLYPMCSIAFHSGCHSVPRTAYGSHHPSPVHLPSPVSRDGPVTPLAQHSELRALLPLRALALGDWINGLMMILWWFYDDFMGFQMGIFKIFFRWDISLMGQHQDNQCILRKRMERGGSEKNSMLPRSDFAHIFGTPTLVEICWFPEIGVPPNHPF